MTNLKIKHPYQVPDGFFDHLDEEMMLKLDVLYPKERKKSVILEVFKYAAIIIAAIFLGRESVRFFPNQSNTSADQEFVTVDLVLTQVSDEEITDFLIENVSKEVITEN